MTKVFALVIRYQVCYEKDSHRRTFTNFHRGLKTSVF